MGDAHLFNLPTNAYVLRPVQGGPADPEVLAGEPSWTAARVAGSVLVWWRNCLEHRLFTALPGSSGGFGVFLQAQRQGQVSS